MGERRGSRGAFQSVGGDTGTDTEVPERLRGYGGTRTLATRDSGTGTEGERGLIEIDIADMGCQFFPVACFKCKIFLGSHLWVLIFIHVASSQCPTCY